MRTVAGKYERKSEKKGWHLPLLAIPVWFFLIELFAWLYLDGSAADKPWQLVFGGYWAVALTCFLRMLPTKAARILFPFLAAGSLVYSVGQSGYYQLFSEMMWLSEFRYASEGSDYLDILLNYPLSWFFWILGLLLSGILLTWKYPARKWKAFPLVLSAALILGCGIGISRLPEKIFENDKKIKYAGSDYGRMQSAEAAYENMFHPHRLYQVCGLYQMLGKDVYKNHIYPNTPEHAAAQAQGKAEIDAYFEEKDTSVNEMTGLLKDKHVVLVLMESMDDWMLGNHTPTINRLMDEGIQFTNFYTPAYGGIRTFNTEFSINTGSFLSSQGGYAFDYVTNHYNQSLANLLEKEGYSAKTFHYNDPTFYSRGVFSQALGYEEYVYYGDYIEETDEKARKNLLYDDLILFSNPGLRQEFYRDADKTLNFVITRSAHLSYKYNEVLSYWGLKKYPEYKGMTGNEETDCALLKARLVDDLFQWLLMTLEDEGKLENTVIIGVTDHYTYGYKNEQELLALSGVTEKLLLEKTPCFIWSAGLKPMKVTKTLNTTDLMPTLLNLLGVESGYDYLGTDAFDPEYDGFVPFSDGSWISGEIAYDAAKKKLIYLTENATPPTENFFEKMNERVAEFTRINNLILDTDYYR